MDRAVFDNQEGGRRVTDAGGVDGMPWQVKAVGIIGVPSAIAIYLVYSMVQGVVPAIANVQTTTNSLVLAMGELTKDHAAVRMQNESMIRILQATCVNAAKTNEERERCFR